MPQKTQRLDDLAAIISKAPTSLPELAVWLNAQAEWVKQWRKGGILSHLNSGDGVALGRAADATAKAAEFDIGISPAPTPSTFNEAIRTIVALRRQTETEIGSSPPRAVAPSKTPHTRRRQQQRQPTVKQLEAIRAVNECEGNFSKAADQLNVDRTTVKQHYDAGMRNAGKLVGRLVKPKTQPIESKRRGALPVAGKDDGQAVIVGRTRQIRDQR